MIFNQLAVKWVSDIRETGNVHYFTQNVVYAFLVITITSEGVTEEWQSAIPIALPPATTVKSAATARHMILYVVGSGYYHGISTIVLPWCTMR
jgi:hypothetical protein